MLELKTEFGRGFGKYVASGGISPEAAMELVPTAGAGALGAAVRHRVQTRGDLAGQRFGGYDDTRKPYLVSAKYPDGAQGDGHWSGAEKFQTSAEYHKRAGVLLGSFSVTGGMWSGLSRVVMSTRRTDILFRGRSDGQNARIVRKFTTNEFGGRTGSAKSKPLKVSNALKAWTVASKAGINLLMISESELVSFANAAGLVMASSISSVLAVEWDGMAPPTDIAPIFRSAFNVPRDLPQAGAIDA